MNRLTLILVAVCVACISAEKPIVHLDNEKIGELVQTFMQCLLETPINPEILIKLRNGEKPKDLDEKQLQKFAYCAFVKSGYGKKNGQIKVDKSIELYPKTADREAIKKVMEECNAKQGKEPQETSLNFLKCFREKSPVKTVF